MRTTSYSSVGFVLHRYPYKETSLILETFTRAYGRVTMVAKGAKRGATSSKYTLNGFQLLTLDWFGRAEMKTLKSAEHERIFPLPRGPALMAAFYINELLLKLAVKDDPHETLFDAYTDALDVLTAVGIGSKDIEVALRRFELTLLAALGYALMLTHEADGATRVDDVDGVDGMRETRAVEEDAAYLYVMERGPIRIEQDQSEMSVPMSIHIHTPMHDAVRVNGKTLLALARGDFTDTTVIAQAKQLMRKVINHQLGDRALYTRQLVRELK